VASLARQQAEVLADAFQEQGFNTRVHTSRAGDTALLLAHRNSPRGSTQIAVTREGGIVVTTESSRGLVAALLKKYGLEKWLGAPPSVALATKTSERAFNVFLGRRKIDTVYRDVLPGQTLAEAADDVRRGLVDHDGYDPDIRVTVRRYT
jgi:hypothetical protein